MQRLVEKFPYKKFLILQWYEAAILNLLVFKHLKEKLSNKIYILISDQGIMLKGATQAYLRTAEQEIYKFLNAKIEELDISGSADFYEHILEYIKEQTDRLKDTRDCPYINLVYSQKLKYSCLSMKKFGYTKPYESWELHERERRGFCYLIVRPEHRWKEIANNIINFVKKKQITHQKTNNIIEFEIPYEKFLWLYQRNDFIEIKKDIEVKEQKLESCLTVSFKQNISQSIDFQQNLKQLSFLYCEEKRKLIKSTNNKSTNIQALVLSSLQVEKITQLIYHEFGLLNLVRDLRFKTQNYLIIAYKQQLQSGKYELQATSKVKLREDISRININEMTSIYKLGKNYDIVSYEGMNFVLAKYEFPLKQNISNMLKIRLPSLPKYYYYFDSKQKLYLLRRYQPAKLKQALEKSKLSQQFFLIYSLILIIKELHKREVFVGSKFVDFIFVDGKRVVIQPQQYGSKEQDKSKLTLFLREWVKNLKECFQKNQLQLLDSSEEIRQLLEKYLCNDVYE